MNKLKIGFKTWSTNLELFDQAETLFQNKKINYLEVYTVPGSSDQTIPLLKKLNIPIILHAPHISHNFNLADPAREESNLKIFEEVKRFAQELNLPRIIVHPGQGNLNQAFKCLEKFRYQNILIENIAKVGTNRKECLGYSPEGIKSFLEQGYGFCLDFSHAIKAACSLNRDYKHFIQEFLTLNPFMFHLCDGNSNFEIDEHLNLGEGNFDLKFLKNCIEESENKIVTLETPRRTHSSFKNDAINLGYLNRLD